MKILVLRIFGFAGLALAVTLAAGALLAASHIQAQGGVPQQGLPGRYSAAFTGAGIETGALLGPFCKSASLAGGTLTIVCEDDDDPNNADAVTTFASAGGGTNPLAIVDVSFDHVHKTFTFTQAGGGTITCRNDVDCPLPASQIIYVGTRAADDLFVAADFTTSSSGNSATGNPPLRIAIPPGINVSHRVAWALPASLTLTSVASGGSGNDCIGLMDCVTGTGITINSEAYKFYPIKGTVEASA